MPAAAQIVVKPYDRHAKYKVEMLRFVLFLTFIAVSVAGSDSKYHNVCNNAFCRIIEDATVEVNELKKVVDEGIVTHLFTNLFTHSLAHII